MITSHFSPSTPNMDVKEEPSSSKFPDSSKAFKNTIKDCTWDILGIPHFITMTYWEGCTLCNKYTTHVILAAKSPTIEVLPHQIELVIWIAWPKVLNHLIDDTCSEIKYSVDYWHNQCDKLKDAVTTTEDRLSSEKDQCCKAESNLADAKSKGKALEKELEELCRESKAMGKCKAPPEPQRLVSTCMFHKWKSTMDSDMAENTSFSQSCWKRQRCDNTALQLPVGGMMPFPESEPIDIGPRHILLLMGFTKVGEQGPDPPLPTTHINVAIPTALTVSLWEKGDSPTSIMGRLPHLLGKTKPRQRSWHVSDPEFQNTLQIARAVQSANQTGK